jgi:hypothetical protein
MTNLAWAFNVNTHLSVLKTLDCVKGCHKTQLGSDETETATENFRKQKRAEITLKTTAKLY